MAEEEKVVLEYDRGRAKRSAGHLAAVAEALRLLWMGFLGCVVGVVGLIYGRQVTSGWAIWVMVTVVELAGGIWMIRRERCGMRRRGHREVQGFWVGVVVAGALGVAGIVVAGLR